MAKAVGASVSRAGDDKVDAWNSEGGVVLENFFTAEEMAPVQHDFLRLHPKSLSTDSSNTPANIEREIGQIHNDQYRNVVNLPSAEASDAINLIGVHPDLIDLARRALGGDVALTSHHTWAKFSGDKPDYDQPFHLDFPAETLLVPSEKAQFKTVVFIIYVSDVSEDNGATSFVPLSVPVDVDRASPFPTDEEQALLNAKSVSAIGGAGSVFMYSSVIHRGTAIKKPDSHRYVIFSSWRRADFPAIRNGVDAVTGLTNVAGWQRYFSIASPEQLQAIGVPLPGHAYWSEQTLKSMKTRYPGWNDTPYRAAFDMKEAG